MGSDNLNINNENMIPRKYIFVFDIQIKIRCVKWSK